MVLVGLSALLVLLTPGLLIAGIMGLAREGRRGRYFFVEQAFYWSTMLYPLLFAVSTFGAILLIGRRRVALACVMQSLPILVPLALYCASMATADW